MKLMSIEENITRQVDMTQNDGLSKIGDLAAQQHHDAYRVFYEFLKTVKPKRILEIGTALGGFTQFLRLVDSTVPILSYDIFDKPWYDDIRALNIDIRVENAFNDDYTIVSPEIINYIMKDGMTLVLCDGGNKIKEFNILSKFLKQGDLIMAHDYVSDNENYILNFNGKIWNWHEICDNDIKEACELNGLVSYEKDIFDKIVWVCKLKQ